MPLRLVVLELSIKMGRIAAHLHWLMGAIVECGGGHHIVGIGVQARLRRQIQTGQQRLDAGGGQRGQPRHSLAQL